MSEDGGQQSVQLLDYQMRELEKYRTAVHKMGQDILTLRQQVRDLEAQNSQLRRDLANYNDTTKLLMDSQDLDGLTKPELAARYGECITKPELAARCGGYLTKPLIGRYGGYLTKPLIGRYGGYINKPLIGRYGGLFIQLHVYCGLTMCVPVYMLRVCC